ncbi:LPXTG cell wall anchor domain-containing protein [Bacillus nitratireducens]|nr:LPXTG cell wall anchor domain-containing protein [Bacillus nitratireducens]
MHTGISTTNPFNFAILISSVAFLLLSFKRKK